MRRLRSEPLGVKFVASATPLYVRYITTRPIPVTVIMVLLILFYLRIVSNEESGSTEWYDHRCTVTA